MSNRYKYANWCEICKKPLPKDAVHEHCPKCNMPPEMLSKYEDACARWGIEGVYHYKCGMCQYTWTKADSKTIA